MRPRIRHTTSRRIVETPITHAEVAKELERIEQALAHSRVLHTSANELAGESMFATGAVDRLARKREELESLARTLHFLCRHRSSETAPTWLTAELSKLSLDVEHLADADGWILQELMLTDLGWGG